MRNIGQAARDEAYKKALAENFTPEDLKCMKGISNGGHHYLGAAKIMAPIGKAFSYLDRKGPLTVGYGARRETIGPELGFGWVMGDAFEEPVLLIKCAWGGKRLAADFRPPSAGKPPYSLGEKTDAAIAQDPTILGKYYRETVTLTKAALANIKGPRAGQRRALRALRLWLASRLERPH